ncbi:MAG: dihydroorotate dehydrogenase (quinone) [Elusimicrobia bacterium RIFCSPLOWO2_01_FULL_54_10]|nr:MAG: dihydroorotate dehydrogenase (quinone) [Elusimicrobia bacterium RIFCSPLOWO2_01_FULL_54_10]
MKIYSTLIRPFLFTLEPERAHRTVFEFLKLIQHVPSIKKVLARRYVIEHRALESSHFGCHFKNPVGVAAGFDKNCEIFDVLPCFGFGFVECGTVTAKDQSGNPGPRMFRLVRDTALINRLGFNNHGADWVEERFKKTPAPEVPLGINIGKSKVTDLARAAEDYCYTFEKLFSFGDYFVVNVSSPNTPGLRELEKNLTPLLRALKALNLKLTGKSGTLKPIFVKVSPDMSPGDLEEAVGSCIKNEVTGIIATNTTLARDMVHLADPVEGGLSGKPLRRKSTETLKTIYRQAKGRLTLIGVGGIFSAQDAYDKILAGASLVQLYTGWVYGGPSTVTDINRGLIELLEKDGFKNVQEAVGKGA